MCQMTQVTEGLQKQWTVPCIDSLGGFFLDATNPCFFRKSYYNRSGKITEFAEQTTRSRLRKGRQECVKSLNFLNRSLDNP